ncbi:MAG: ABC transporter permease [Pseudonocardiaceae bacterium]
MTTASTGPEIGPGAGPVMPHYSEFGTGARTQRQTVLRRFRRHRAAMISVVLFALLVLVAIVAPSFYPYDHTYTAGGYFEAPTAAHLLGTDQIGRDMIALILRGTQFSLLISIVVAVMATVIGVTLGTLSGYLGGMVDTVVSRVIDLFLIFPLIAIVGILVHAFDGSWYVVAVVLGFFSWMTVARINRGETLSLAQREFVEAAKALGAGTPRIVFRHILPNLTGTITVNATLAVAIAVLAEAGLSFIGLGVQPPDISLGLIIQDNYEQFGDRWWLFWPPFLVIVAISLCINFIGDGLRDAFDPRQTRVRA